MNAGGGARANVGGGARANVGGGARVAAPLAGQTPRANVGPNVSRPNVSTGNNAIDRSVRSGRAAADRALQPNAGQRDLSGRSLSGRDLSTDRTRAGNALDRTARRGANDAITARRPVIDGSLRGSTDARRNAQGGTMLRNNLSGSANVGRNGARLNATNRTNIAATSRQNWNNLNSSWTNYGVPRYHRNWYRGAWGGWGGGLYSPFGFGGLGGFGLGYGGYPYGGYGLGGYGLGGYGLGGYGLGGGFGYGYNPFFLNSMGYRWGYYGYNNPYYYADQYSYPYNYSQPVYVTTGGLYVDDQSNQAVSVDQSTLHDFDDARAAFRQGDYDTSLQLINRVVRDNPSDTMAHEFRALVLFAMGRYEESAATLNPLLATSPGMNWDTMQSLYPNVDTYSHQLRALEDDVHDHPDDAAARFVLAYHYLVTNYPDAARRQLEQVVELEPQDRVSQQLLAGLNQSTEDRASRDEEVAASRREDRLPPDAQTDLVGHWTGEAGHNAAFRLDLANDGEFTWAAEHGRDSTKVTGEYELDGQTLVLHGDKGETLIGHLTAEDEDRFNFKLVGSPPNDPGIEFEKTDR
jgi:tetratricopeptide (TPR) repeat protein